MKVEDFDKLRTGDNIVSHNPVDGETHRGKVVFVQIIPPLNGVGLHRVGRVKIEWDDKSEKEVWRDELFTYPEIFDTFTVEPS